MLDTFFTKLPKNQERLQLWAGLSDPINNVVIKNRSRAIWNQVRTFVVTPDKTMDRAVRRALARFFSDCTFFVPRLSAKDMVIRAVL